MTKKIILIIFPVIILFGLAYYKISSNQKTEDIKNTKMLPIKIKNAFFSNDIKDLNTSSFSKAKAKGNAMRLACVSNTKLCP